MTRVLLIDDQEMIRIGLRTIVGAHPDLTVVAEAGDGLTALRLLRQHEIDVVLLDLRMPGIDGVETTRRIRAAPPPDSVRILVLTTFDQDENVLAALRAGADGFLGKGAGPAELTAAIVRVSAGGHALSEAAVDAVVGHLADATPAPGDPAVAALFDQLTPREREVVEPSSVGSTRTRSPRCWSSPPSPSRPTSTAR